jgi:branched-chain amino acid aminotransferase
LKTQKGAPFALSRHIARLNRSARGLGLPELNPDAVRAAVDEVMAAQRFPLGTLRITYTSGPGPLGSDRGEGGTTLVCVSMPRVPWPPTTSVATSPWRRNERSALAGLKTTSYAENAVCLARARQAGAGEAILANLAGNLCEGTGSNVFVVLDGEVRTPPLSDGCLAGITRDLVIEWCGAVEQTLPMSVLRTADEVFITSSTRDVHPVDGIDDRELVAPGPVTAEVQRCFAQCAAADPDPE